MRTAVTLVLCVAFAFSSSAQTLRFATLNYWSGLDYHGTFTMGEYETSGERERRFQALVAGLRSERPDVVALQETNSIGELVPKLAGLLGYDFVFERTNGGIKIGTLGIPWNLNEGLGILARRELKLQRVVAWDISSAFGISGNTLSFHVSDKNKALVARISVGDEKIYVIDTHLPSASPCDSAHIARLKVYLESRRVQAPGEITEQIDVLERAYRRRVQAIQLLQEHIHSTLSGSKVILLGDLNATPQSSEVSRLIQDNSYLDVAAVSGIGGTPTWDAERNPTIRFSRSMTDARGRPLSPTEMVDAWNDGISRRIDYILLNEKFDRSSVLGARLILNSPIGGVFVSDHFGLLGEIVVRSTPAK